MQRGRDAPARRESCLRASKLQVVEGREHALPRRLDEGENEISLDATEIRSLATEIRRLESGQTFDVAEQFVDVGHRADHPAGLILIEPALPLHPNILGAHPPIRNASCPAKRARAPSESSMRNSWLYFASRSPRAGAPALICPVPRATARSAMNESSVSPER